MYNEKNLKNKAVPCKLVHPLFNENFQSLNHAATWLSKQYLMAVTPEPIYVPVELITFLLRNGGTYQNEGHPLHGLQVQDNAGWQFKVDTLFKDNNL
jgi:hypothetical protein